VGDLSAVTVVCRWLAYSGSPVLLADLLYGSEHSLIVQSLHARLGNEETNGDGFGIGWYGEEDAPAVFRGIEPAWNDRNLSTSRSTSGRAWSSRTSGYRRTRRFSSRTGKRDLVLEVDPALYPEIEGSTDSEVFFYLALTFGLEEDPPGAVARAVGLIEAVGRRHGVEVPIQMSVATTDGGRVWRSATRAGAGRARSSTAPTSRPCAGSIPTT
jgi:predicted glutamine amidotransferase